MVDEESSGKTYLYPTPHPSACGCHLLPLEKAFVCFLRYLLISINPLFQILTHPNQTLTHRKKCHAQHPGTPLSRPLCHPERRAKLGVEPAGRPQVGISERRAHKPLHCTSATVKQSGNPYPFPLSKSLLKGVRGKLFSRKVSPVTSSPPTTILTKRRRQNICSDRCGRRCVFA